MALVGLAHGSSHFFHMLLPPLFPWLIREFGFSWAELGLLVSLFPAIMPGKLSYIEAAAPQASLQFMLPGVLIFVPLILAYTCWGYRIFAGKVEDFTEGY